MTQAVQAENSLPRHTLLIAVFIGELIPFIARLPAVPFRGWEWVAQYWFGPAQELLFVGFNFIPTGVLYFALSKASKRAPISFWFACIAAAGFLMYAHGTLNLRSTSTASIALVFIPVYTAAVSVCAWLIGRLLDLIIRRTMARNILATCTGVIALGTSVGMVIDYSQTRSEVQARFPVVSVSKQELQRRHINGCCTIEAMAYDDFDEEPGKEIAVLGLRTIDVLRPGTYETKTSIPMDHECTGGVGMYPYLVTDSKGDILVTTSSGVSNPTRNCVWSLSRSGFTRLVPLRLPEGPTYFSYDMARGIERHDAAGKVLWRISSDVVDVGIYTTKEGEQFPFAVVPERGTRAIQVYDVGGKPRFKIELPAWVQTVHQLDWPSRGNILAGSGASIGVFDMTGKEILHHMIQGTSFPPYHGPDGVAVKLDPHRERYLAIVSHGSSGYARSVLLIFSPEGELVWQEELDKVRAILAVPGSDAGSEVLLLGGLKGLDEYALARKLQ
jgi:hypothetical protein